MIPILEVLIACPGSEYKCQFYSVGKNLCNPVQFCHQVLPRLYPLALAFFLVAQTIVKFTEPQFENWLKI